MIKNNKYENIKKELKKLNSKDDLKNNDVKNKINLLFENYKDKINNNKYIDFKEIKEEIQKKIKLNQTKLIQIKNDYNDILNLKLLEFKNKLQNINKERLFYKNKCNSLITNNKNKFDLNNNEFLNSNINIKEINNKINKIKSKLKKNKIDKEDYYFNVKKKLDIKLNEVKLMIKIYKNDNNKELQYKKELFNNLKNIIYNELKNNENEWNDNIKNLFSKIELTFKKIDCN